MKSGMAWILRGLTVAGAIGAFTFGASAQTHYRFAHDQQLKSGYCVSYVIFSSKLKALS